MAKSIKKRMRKPIAAGAATAKPMQPLVANSNNRTEAGSKQARIITMLRSRTGASIAAMMKETDWQQHSVRGFLVGVVRKKLKLKLASEKIDGTRIYRIEGADDAKVSGQKAKRRAA